MSDPRNSLKNIALLKHLPSEALEDLERQCSWKKYQPNELLIDRHTESKDVCLIVEGRVRVVNHSLSGKEISFEDVEAGSFIGELSAIDGKPRSASILAINTTLVAFMPANVFIEAVTKDPEAGKKLLSRLAVMVRHSTERIMELSTLGANNRVHAELLRLASKNIKPDNTARISPIPIHSDIASRVSTTRETVARVLSDLTKKGVIQKDQRALVVSDYIRLEKMVDDVRGE